MSKTAILCARVSTDAQAEHGRSLTSQLEGMRRYAHAQGFTVADEITDEISGAIPIRQRPGGATLYTYIDAHTADAVIFHAVDRITRDEDLIEINVIRRDVRNAGMELHYAADGGKADLSTMGGMIDTLKAAVAAEERKKIIERNMRGRMAKAQAGKWVGEGNPSYGFRKLGKLREARLEINREQAAIVRRIFALYLGADGNPPMSIRGISELLSNEGIPTPQGGLYWCNRTVHIVLKNTSYIGKFPYRGIEILLPDLAIIDEATFDAAQARMKKNQDNHVRRQVNKYLLTSRIRCVCGRAMSTRIKKGKYLYYTCSSMFLPSVARTCHEPSVRADTLDAQTWDWLMNLLNDEAQLTAGIDQMLERQQANEQPHRERVNVIAVEELQIKRRIDRWVAQYADATDEELASLRAQVKAASKELTARRAERTKLELKLNAQAKSKADREGLLAIAAALRDGILEADHTTRLYALEQLDLRCKIKKNGDDYRAAVSCGFDDDAADNEWSIATKLPRNAPPATPAPHCDTRPAPKIRDDPAR